MCPELFMGGPYVAGGGDESVFILVPYSSMGGADGELNISVKYKAQPQ